MRAASRDCESSDEEPLVALSLRAWEPVFAAVAEALGPVLLARLRGDRRAGQAREVRGVLADRAQRVRVAEADGALVGDLAGMSPASAATKAATLTVVTYLPCPASRRTRRPGTGTDENGGMAGLR